MTADKPRTTFGRRNEAPAGAAVPNDTLRALLKTPREKRDDTWGNAFFEAVAEGTFVALGAPLQSPSGHFAFGAVIANGEANALTFAAVAKKAVDAGLAVALFARRGEEPDFAFTHGWLSSILWNGKLMPWGTRPGGSAGHGLAMPAGTTYTTGEPSHELLPPATRAALRTWLDERHGMKDVRISLLMERPACDLALAVDFVPMPAGEDDLDELLSGIGWYLPPDVAVGVFPFLRDENYIPL